MPLSKPVTRLPRAPLARWLEQLVAQNGTAGAALDLGIAPRNVYRHRREAGDTISLRHADRLLTAARGPHQLAILYPLDEPAHDRWCETCHDVVTTNDDLRCPWCESDTTP